jgi:hypothetical protein
LNGLVALSFRDDGKSVFGQRGIYWDWKSNDRSDQNRRR